MVANIKDQFTDLKNLIIDSNWLPISKEKIDILENFLIEFLKNEKIPIPYIFPTTENDVLAEWSPNTVLDEVDLNWAISIETNGDVQQQINEVIKGGFTLHALNINNYDCIFEAYYYNGDYAYTINDDDSICIERDKINLSDRLIGLLNH